MARVVYCLVLLCIFKLVSCRILDGLRLNPELLKISTHAIQGNDYLDYNPDHIAKDILIEVPDSDVIIDIPNKPGTMVEVEKWTLDDGDEETKYKVVSPDQTRLVEFSSVQEENED